MMLAKPAIVTNRPATAISGALHSSGEPIQVRFN
ncbi:MAG: hypothetical protein RI998_91, partial [Pseudomonadota bacterium]